MNPIIALLMHFLGGGAQGGPQQPQPARPPSAPGGAAPRGAPNAMPPIMQILMALAQHATESAQQQGGKPNQPQPKGTPAMQGRQGGGAANMRNGPNQGGYAGPSASETTNPGMAHMASLLGGGPPPGLFGSSSLGNLPTSR